MHTSLIMINRNGGRYLQTAIASLLEAFAECDKEKGRFEFVFVDNGSSDESISTVTEQLDGSGYQYTITLQPEPGVNSARNAGLKIARGKYLIFIDNDLTFDRKWLKAYLHAFDHEPESQIFAGRILLGNVDGDIPPWLAIQDPYIRKSIVIRCDNGASIAKLKFGNQTVDGPAGPNMAFKKTIFEQYGNFDESFGLRPGSLIPGAEAEFFHRIRKHESCFTYVADALVYHPLKKGQLSKSYFLGRVEGIGRVLCRLQHKENIAFQRCFGIKRYLFRCYIEQLIKAVVSTIFGSRQKSFHHRCEARRVLGQMKEDRYTHLKSLNN